MTVTDNFASSVKNVVTMDIASIWTLVLNVNAQTVTNSTVRHA